MAASTDDKFKKVGESTVTTLASPGKAEGATSVNVASTANYPTDTGIVIAIRQVDTDGNLVAGTYTEWSATVSSETSLAIDATPVYGSDQIYPAGSTTQVFIPVSSSAHNDLVDGLLVSHNQDGTIKDAQITNAKLSTTAGQPGGAWLAWTPTLSGRFTDAKWTKACYYTQIGKTVICRLRLTANATSPMAGGAGTPVFTLPVAARDSVYTGVHHLGTCRLHDSGLASVIGIICFETTTTGFIVGAGVSGSTVVDTGVTDTAPFTWTTNDNFVGTFTYEAA